MGFTDASCVATEPVVSYTAISPLPFRSCPENTYFPTAPMAVFFLLHLPWSRLHRMLSGIPPCEARTFLGDLRRDSVSYCHFHVLIISVWAAQTPPSVPRLRRPMPNEDNLPYHLQKYALSHNAPHLLCKAPVPRHLIRYDDRYPP